MVNKLFDSLFKKHKNNPDCFLKLIDEKKINYDEFLKISGRFSNLFKNLNLTPNDRVAVQIDKSPEALAI